MGAKMTFEVGKIVEAESESTARAPRSGVVEEVLRGDPSPRYRIRWDDGHESIYTPASGALRAGQGRPGSRSPRRYRRRGVGCRPRRSEGPARLRQGPTGRDAHRDRACLEER